MDNSACCDSEVKVSLLPICPECRKDTIVLFTPPRDGIVGTKEGYETIGTPEYVDWNRAHLYCCNGETNCGFNTKLSELTTPRTASATKKVSKLETELVELLSRYCGERGDNEGATETLERVINERNLLLRRVVEKDIFHKR